MSITYKCIAPLFVLRIVLGLVGLRSLASIASYGAWLLVLLDLPLVLGRFFTFAAWVALPNDHLYVTSLRIHAWLAVSKSTSAFYIDGAGRPNFDFRTGGSRRTTERPIARETEDCSWSSASAA